MGIPLCCFKNSQKVAVSETY